MVWVRWGEKLGWDRLTMHKFGGAGRLEKRAAKTRWGGKRWMRVRRSGGVQEMRESEELRKQKGLAGRRWVWYDIDRDPNRIV